MRYVAPVAELVSVETVSVILTSGLTPEEPVVTTTVAQGGGNACGTQLPMGEEE